MNKKEVTKKFRERIEYRDVLSCMRCGLCINHCPTYKTYGKDEVNSPRGRIALVRSIIEGLIEPSEDVRRALDNCILCKKCMEVCPSRVKYDKIINESRKIFDEEA